jgi:hypothetical protein
MKVKVALVPEITDGARNLPKKEHFDGWMVSRIEIPFAQIADSDIFSSRQWSLPSPVLGKTAQNGLMTPT